MAEDFPDNNDNTPDRSRGADIYSFTKAANLKALRFDPDRAQQRVEKLKNDNFRSLWNQSNNCITQLNAILENPATRDVRIEDMPSAVEIRTKLEEINDICAKLAPIDYRNMRTDEEEKELQSAVGRWSAQIAQAKAFLMYFEQAAQQGPR
ncbi:MAG TPA: hypothetical protein VNM40_03810 [Candidatus Paceibacterota bacterium]|nr:hypothetical protein [Candidatus Paceibacterota bacterium]